MVSLDPSIQSVISLQSPALTSVGSSPSSCSSGCRHNCLPPPGSVWRPGSASGLCTASSYLSYPHSSLRPREEVQTLRQHCDPSPDPSPAAASPFSAVQRPGHLGQARVPFPQTGLALHVSTLFYTTLCLKSLLLAPSPGKILLIQHAAPPYFLKPPPPPLSCTAVAFWNMFINLGT